MLDIFHDDAFSIARLSARVNRLPYVPGQIGASGIFEEDGIDTTTVAIEKRDNSLALVGPTPRGGPGESIIHDRDELRYFGVPHFQRNDAMYADEVMGRRAFGTENEMETVLSRIDSKIDRHLRDFDATIEHQRVGAIKGIVTNKAGGVMFNLYNMFDMVAPAAYQIPLNNPEANLRNVFKPIVYAVEDALDAPYSGIDAWCGRNFWDALVGHKYLKDAYVALRDRQGILGQSEVDELSAFNINFKRYRTGQKAQLANGNSPFIGANECRFVLRGVPGLFITRFAPADYMETVNTIGLPRYLKQRQRDDDKGVNLEVQTNPINLCTQPNLLFSATIAP